MLKIKDNVELKELEKYGFKKEYIVDSWAYILNYTMNLYEENMFVWLDNRHIQVNGIKLLSTLFDMIQDGIVEKVE